MRERIERVTGLDTSLIISAPHLKKLSETLIPADSRSPALDTQSGSLVSSVPSLFLNSRLLPAHSLARLIEKSPAGTMFTSDGELVGFTLPPLKEKIRLEKFFDPQRGHIESLAGKTLREVEVESYLVQNVWDMIAINKAQLADDFTLCTKKSYRNQVFPPEVIVKNAEKVWISELARISPQVILDASEGPIVIEEGVRVLPFSCIEGPAYVGRDTTVCGATIRGGTTIGPVCRVGGEVECSIFQGFANKAHDGFLGHSIVGEWVNLGAGTITSDLKNNYSDITIELGGSKHDTKMDKMGALIGDHVKTGIGTLINTGAVFGVGCSLFGGGIQPKSIPPFIWGGSGIYEEYDLRLFLITAAVVMERRKKKLTATIRRTIEAAFRTSAPERSRWLTEVGTA